MPDQRIGGFSPDIPAITVSIRKRTALKESGSRNTIVFVFIALACSACSAFFLNFKYGLIALPLALIVGLLVYYYETLLAVNLVIVLLEALPGLEHIIGGEPSFLYIRISVAALLLLTGLDLFLNRRKVLSPPLSTFLLILFFFLMLLLTLSQITDFALQGRDKYWFVGLFQLANGPIFLYIMGFLLPYLPDRCRRFFPIFWFVLFLVALLLFYQNRADIFSGHIRRLLSSEEKQAILPIMIARMMGAGTLMAIIYYLRSRSLLLRIGAVAGGGLMLSLLVLSNERGALVFFLAIVVFMMWVTRRTLNRKLRMAFIIPLILIMVLGAYQKLDPRYNRFLQTFDAGVGQESRLQIYVNALSFFADNVIGGGYGGFGKAMPLLGYPHNIFLEALTEAGILGFALLVCFLLALFRESRLVAREGPPYDMVTYLLLFFFLNAQTSGNFAGNIHFFFFAAIVAGRSAILRTSLPSSRERRIKIGRTLSGNGNAAHL